MSEEEQINKEIEILKSELQRYEEDGPAKLYYSLRRKSWEMADLLNNTNLKTLDIDEPKSKTFDRLKVIWQDAATIGEAIKSLGISAGITGDESADIKRKPYSTDKLAGDRI